MFRRKNRLPVLTETTCQKLENIRTALEVLAGQRVQFVQIDLNQGRGKVRAGQGEKNFCFIFSRSDLLQFAFLGPDEEARRDWHSALFENDVVRVASEKNPRMHGRYTMRWVGTSATDRKEEPLFFDGIKRCAEVQGVTVEEFLDQP